MNIRKANIDTYSNVKRMKLLIAEVNTYRRLNYPDGYSLMLIDVLINQLELLGFSQVEIRYAISRIYSKRIRKYECIAQYQVER